MALSDSEFKSLQDSFGKPPLAESLDIASRTTPDAAAKSQKLGLSPDAYTANKPEIDRKLNLQEINPAGLQESHPATADWLSNPNNSSVAQGDLRVLKGVEDTVKSMQGSYVGQRFDELKSGLSNTGKLGYYASEAGKSMYNALPFVDQAAPGTSKADSLKVGTDILNAPMDATKSIARLANSAAKDLAVMPLGGIAVSIDKAFGTKLANKYVFPMAEYLDKSNQTLALRRNAGLVGKVSDTIGSLAGLAGEAEVTAGPRLATEATTAATKLWPAMANILRHGVASSAAPALTSAIDTGQAVYDQTKDGLQAFNAAQAYYLSTVGFMMAPFSYEGKLANRAALGVTTGVVGGEVAREYTNANMPAMPADMQKPASFEEALLNGIMGAGFGVIGGRRPVERVKPSPEARAISDTLDSIDEQHNIDKIVQYSQDSATNKVSKEHYNDFVKSLDPNRKVFIPQEAAAQMKDAPDYIKEQINGLGTDVSVPLHKFASDIATNKDWMDVVRPHIKLSDKSLSQTELSNGTNSEIQAILKQAQQNKKTLTEADKIYSDVKDQLVATGMQSEATARHSAELYPAIATVYAEKARAMGHDVSLSDIYNMMGFKVESGDVNKGTIIDQRSVPDTAFSPEKEQALTDAFKTDPAMPDKAAPEKVTLADKGFSPEEIASLQKDGMATDGTMDKPQFDQWQAERANRLNRDVPQGTSKASPEQTAATDGKQIDIPEGFDRFVELAKKSSSVEGFMEAAQKMNDTPQAVSQWFGDKYNPDGNLSMKKAAEKFLSDVKNGEYDAAPNKAQIPERRNLGANRPERRTDINHRQDINAMTDQQRIDELQKLRGDRVTDPLTQLPNDTAFNEDFADKSLGFDTVVALDMDGLGWHNDNWGHVVTDSILAQLGQRLKNLSTEDYKLYRLHGDEFAALTKGSESADKRSAEVQDILDNTTVKITGTKEIDGKEQQVEYTKVGLGLSYGVGDTYAKADEQSYTNKAQREASGKRSPKGTEPPGLHERIVGTGGQDNGGQASGVAYNQSAFHSSPHSFDKFSLDNIGTGEGAQAYGHGLYFAENTDVSNFYKQNVGAKGLVFETADDANIFKNPTPSEKNVLNEVERRWNRDNWYLLDKDELNDRMGEFLDGFIKNRKIEIENPDLRETRKEIANAELDAAIKIRGSMKNSTIYDNPGYEYEVDIPDEHVKNFLNWDKPRSEQPESVQKALQPLLDSEKTRLNITDNSMLDKRHPQGSSLYKALINQTGSKQAASEYLNSLGIKGIKYLDGSSRAKGEGTHNLVVFDDSIIKILSRNGEPVTPAEAKQVKADMHDQQDAAPQKQTDTPEFRNWFGKSVVTKDGKAGGEPLVVYHGTSEKGLENSIFDKSLLGTVTKSRSAKAGFFFVDNKKVAEGYSGLANDKPVADLIEQSQRAERQGKWDLANELMVKAEKLEQSQKPSSKVVDSYLSIKDPYVFDAEEQRFLDIQDEIHDVIKEAQKNGNDGIVLKNLIDNADWGSDTAADHWIAFEPTQIKSATDNSGQFDPKNPNILFQGPRASVQFTDTGSIVRLSKSADLSSFLHESGHIFLEMEKRFAAKYGQSESQKTLLDWLGVKSFDDIGVNEHEKFAETFEQYLREGKAPSLKLRDAFAAFSRWLSVIYRKLKDSRLSRANLTPEIKEYMDRMLATEDEINQAMANPAYDQLFRSKEQAGMTDAEWEKYQAQVSKVKNVATADLQQKVIDELRKRKTKEWTEERAPLIDEEMKNLEKLPVYQVLAKADEVPMDRALLKEMGDIQAIPPQLRGKTTTDGSGANPEDYARANGYKSVKSMVKDIMAAKSLRAAATDAAQARMLAKHGDMLNDGSIELEAREAVHNEEEAKLLLMEIKSMNKGKPEIDREYMKAQTKSLIGTMTYGEIKPTKFYRAEIKAAQKAALATTKEDKLNAKIQQLANHYLYKEAVSAKDAADKMRKHIRNVETRKYTATQVSPEYIRHLKMYTAASDFRANTKMNEQAAIEELHRVAMWALAQKDESLGLEIELYDNNLNTIIEADKMGLLSTVKLKSWDDMTNQELRGIYDMTKHLRYVGGQLSENVKAQKKIKNTRIANALRKTAPKIDKAARGSKKRAILDGFTGYAADVFLHADSVLRRLDGRKDNGVVYNSIKKPIDIATSEKMIPMREAAGEFQDKIYHDHYDNKEIRKMNAQLDIDGHDVALTKWQIISMALNYGTESNRQALFDSTIEGKQPYTQDVVEAAFDQHMTKNDWNFVQEVWKDIGSYKEEAFTIERKMKGVAPPSVEGIPIQTKFGTIEGKYYRLIYDPIDSIRVTEETEIDIEKSMMFGRFSKAKIAAGMMKERVGSGGRPVMLDIMGWHKQVNDAIRYISMAEAVHDVQDVIGSPEFRTALSETGNMAYASSLDTWLKDTASGEIVSADAVSRILRHVRTGFSISNVGWNFGTILLQPLGLANSAVVVGYKNLAKGFSTYIRHPLEITRQINANDAFMRERSVTFNKDIYDTLDALHGKPNRPSYIPLNVRKSFFYGIVFTQQMVDSITYIGAYEQAKANLGVNASDSDLRHAAGRAVARSQASGLWSDRTPIGRGTMNKNIRNAEIVRIWSTLGSYMFATGNLAAERFGQTNFKNPAQAAQFTTDMMVLFAAQAVIMGLIKNDAPNQDDKKTKAQYALEQGALQAVSSFPFLREVGSEFQGFHGGSTMASVDNLIGNAGKQVYQIAFPPDGKSHTDEIDLSLFKSLNKLGGVAFHYPSTAINRAADSFVKQMNGKDIEPIDYLMWRKKDK